MTTAAAQETDRGAPGRSVRRAVQLFVDQYLATGLPAALPEQAVVHLYDAAALAASIAGVERDESALAIATEEFLARLCLWLDEDALDEVETSRIVQHARHLLAKEFAATRH